MRQAASVSKHIIGLIVYSVLLFIGIYIVEFTFIQYGPIQAANKCLLADGPSPQCSDLNIIGTQCWLVDPGESCGANGHSVGTCYNGNDPKTVCCLGAPTPTPTPCSCSPDPCDIDCPHPNPSPYRRHKTTDSDFVRDCSDPCNPNEYNCSCDNYSNSAPSCSISLPSTINYNALEYINALGTTIGQRSTPVNAVLHINDADEGDNHQIVSVTVSKNCLSATKTNGADLNGTTIGPSDRNFIFHVRGLGALDGISPNLTSNNGCHVTLSVRIKDLPGDSGDSSAYRTCSASTTIVYPVPRLLSFQLIDNNPSSVIGKDEAEQTTLQSTQFSLIGSTAKDPNTATIVLNNAGTPTQTLADVNHRFTARVYKRSDRAYFTIIATISDSNGNRNIDLTHFHFNLQNVNGNAIIPLQTMGNFVWDVSSGQYLDIYTYGINSSGGITRFSNSDWNQCLDSGYEVCIRGKAFRVDNNTTKIQWDIYPKENSSMNLPGQRYYFYVQQISDKEGVNILKGLTNTILHNTRLNLLDSDLHVKDKDNNAWTARSYLYLDTTPPQLESINFEKIGTDSIRMHIVVNDTNHVDSGYHPSLPIIPIARTYLFAENPRSGNIPGVTNRFLKATNGHTINGQDYGNSQNRYGWHLDNSFSNTDNRKAFYLDAKGILGGDKVYYGFCLYDLAGNANCINSDDSNPFTTGRNWIKTSLGHVYSYGGFAGLPNYQDIVNVNEIPTSFRNFVSPFNSTQYATLSTFSVIAKTTDSNSVRWGYNGNYDNPAFYFLNTTFEQAKWEDFLTDVLQDHCEKLDACRQFIHVTNANSLVSALQDNHAYKVIYVDNSMTLPDSVKYINNNIVVVQNGAHLTLFELYKNGGLRSLNDSLLFIAKDNSTVIIDDKPNTGYDNTTDVVQAGFIILGTSHFRELQGLSSGTRDAYKDSNGNYDKLVLHGLLYSQTVPILERDLVFSDNDKYPSEWFIYDTNLLNNLLPLLGRHKIQTFKCGVVDHPLCK